MKTVGVREVRQNLSALLEEVSKGREITITNHGKPVALLSLPKKPESRGLPDLSAFRKSLKLPPGTGDALVQAIIDERNESY